MGQNASQGHRQQRVVILADGSLAGEQFSGCERVLPLKRGKPFSVNLVEELPERTLRPYVVERPVWLGKIGHDSLVRTIPTVLAPAPGPIIRPGQIVTFPANLGGGARVVAVDAETVRLKIKLTIASSCWTQISSVTPA